MPFDKNYVAFKNAQEDSVSWSQTISWTCHNIPLLHTKKVCVGTECHTGVPLFTAHTM